MCMHVCVCVCVCVCACESDHYFLNRLYRSGYCPSAAFGYMCVSAYLYVYVCVCMYECGCVCMCVYMRV